MKRTNGVKAILKTATAPVPSREQSTNTMTGNAFVSAPMKLLKNTALTASTSFLPPPCVKEFRTEDIQRTTKIGQGVSLLWTRKTHGNTMSAVTPDLLIFLLPTQDDYGIGSDYLTAAIAKMKAAIGSTIPTGYWC